MSEPSPSSGPARVSRTARIAIVTFACLFGATLIAFAWYALWVARESVQQAAKSSAPIELPSRTVAVLPFENLAGDSSIENLALNITEDVLRRLSNVPELTVISRSPSFTFRGKPADAREIGRALNARYLLVGSVQSSGKRLRVTAQLIDATTGNHVWSRRFEEPIGDMLEVGDQIAHGVARALEVSLGDTSPYAQ